MTLLWHRNKKSPILNLSRWSNVRFEAQPLKFHCNLSGSIPKYWYRLSCNLSYDNVLLLNMPITSIIHAHVIMSHSILWSYSNLLTLFHLETSAFYSITLYFITITTIFLKQSLLLMCFRVLPYMRNFTSFSLNPHDISWWHGDIFIGSEIKIVEFFMIKFSKPHVYVSTKFSLRYSTRKFSHGHSYIRTISSPTPGWYSVGFGTHIRETNKHQ